MLKFVFDNILKHSNMFEKHGLSFAESQGFKRLINKLLCANFPLKLCGQQIILVSLHHKQG